MRSMVLDNSRQNTRGRRLTLQGYFLVIQGLVKIGCKDNCQMLEMVEQCKRRCHMSLSHDQRLNHKPQQQRTYIRPLLEFLGRSNQRVPYITSDVKDSVSLLISEMFFSAWHGEKRNVFRYV
ncbi:Uncharacterized protein HZ326_20618 [Fusarium oxysporum f. sp. albedinis]|nr:Uncharacterized protein HZ326_20618 [Fusarium oxysporum f. sp. albedinis]